MGLKCVAIYRDGSKRSQPLNTKKTNEGGDKTATATVTAAAVTEQTLTLETRVKELETELMRLHGEVGKPLRRKLPDTRASYTHKFDVAGHEGYLTVGIFPDGSPGEMFITMSKEGSTIGGLMDSVAALTSMSLQYGVPLDALVRKFAHQRFEPSGFTKNPEIGRASSIIDYVFRWLAFQFIPGYRETNAKDGQPNLPLPGLTEIERQSVNRSVPELPLSDDTDILVKSEVVKGAANGKGDGYKVESLSDALKHFMHDAPACPKCGHIAVRNGACFKCLNCGESLGCS
jgi:ribonucleoside-diphosphate reductase alpha chain